jgi:chorismate mutase
MHAVREGTNKDLKAARERVGAVTEQIVDLFCERQKLMADIAHAKNGNGEAHLPIFLPQREQELLAHFRQIAKEKDVDPNMMDMLVSMLMSAAKFTQMKHSEARDNPRHSTSIDRFAQGQPVGVDCKSGS